MVVSGEAFTFYNEVSVKFHLFARDTGLVRDTVGHGTAIKCERLHLFYACAACNHCCVKDVLGQCHEVGVLSHEVGFALKGENSTIVAIYLYEHATFSSLTVGTLSGNSLTALAHEFYSSIKIAFSFCEGILTIAQTSTGEGTELLDIFNIYSHFGYSISWGFYKKRLQGHSVERPINPVISVIFMIIQQQVLQLLRPSRHERAGCDGA